MSHRHSGQTEMGSRGLGEMSRPEDWEEVGDTGDPWTGIPECVIHYTTVAPNPIIMCTSPLVRNDLIKGQPRPPSKKKKRKTKKTKKQTSKYISANFYKLIKLFHFEM